VKTWILLFGGAGRQGVIQRLIKDGISIDTVFVPSRQSIKLEEAIHELKTLGCNLREVLKSELEACLRPLAGKGLLSLGFPYLLSADLLRLFKPALNVHPTLLPRYRGPTSGAYILINNESESGSTVHHMTCEMDRGDIVAQSRVNLSPFDTIRSLQRKVYALEPQLVINAVNAIECGERPSPQDEDKSSTYSKLRSPADSQIDPSRPLTELINHIRACDPKEYPAFFMHHGQKMHINVWRTEKPIEEDDML